jgi:hypothetical protein
MTPPRRRRERAPWAFLRARRRPPLRRRMVGARGYPRFMASVTFGLDRAYPGRGSFFVSLCPRGPGRTEQPLLERDPVHDPLAVRGLDAARGAARRARQLPRQLRGGDAGVAACASDPKHHLTCSLGGEEKAPAVSPRGSLSNARRVGEKGTPRRAGDPSTPMAWQRR